MPGEIDVGYSISPCQSFAQYTSLSAYRARSSTRPLATRPADLALTYVSWPRRPSDFTTNRVAAIEQPSRPTDRGSMADSRFLRAANMARGTRCVGSLWRRVRPLLTQRPLLAVSAPARLYRPRRGETAARDAARHGLLLELRAASQRQYTDRVRCRIGRLRIRAAAATAPSDEIDPA